MKKCLTLMTMFVGIASLSFAETNALIEVKLFKTWVIEGEINFGNLAIKNTGDEPILLAKDAFDFEDGQLVIRLLSQDPRKDLEQEKEYQMMAQGRDKLLSLPSGETHIYDGHKFYLGKSYHFSEKIHFTVSIYLGKDFWLDSEPLIVKGVVPDTVEDLAAINNKKVNTGDVYKLMAVTYNGERWLYIKSLPNAGLFSGKYCYPICPINLTNKIRVEPYDDKEQFKIWDGEKSMIYHKSKNMLVEGSDEHNVLGKWTRERKQKAEADNAEVRRKKAEEVK